MQQVLPVGSQGLQAEFLRLFGQQQIKSSLDVGKTAAGMCGNFTRNQSRKRATGTKNFY